MLRELSLLQIKIPKRSWKEPSNPTHQTSQAFSLRPLTDRAAPVHLEEDRSNGRAAARQPFSKDPLSCHDWQLSRAASKGVGCCSDSHGTNVSLSIHITATFHGNPQFVEGPRWVRLAHNIPHFKKRFGMLDVWCTSLLNKLDRHLWGELHF